MQVEPDYFWEVTKEEIADFKGPGLYIDANSVVLIVPSKANNSYIFESMYGEDQVFEMHKWEVPVQDTPFVNIPVREDTR